MSIRWTAAAWRAPDVGPGELLVLLALADFADDTGLCWPSVSRIGEMTRQSARTVQRHLSELEARGLIERTERCEHGMSTKYRLKSGGGG